MKMRSLILRTYSMKLNMNSILRFLLLICGN